MDTSYSSVAGTEQNNIFEEYKREAYRLDSLRRCLHSHYVEQVEKRMMDAGLEQSMCDEDFRLSSQEEKLAYRFIRRNHYSPAAIWVLEQMQSRFDEDELRSLLSGFGGRSKNAQILSDISLRLRNADKVEPGNPYVDVPLIEYSGRKENLSGYIGYARYTAIGFWRSDSEPSCRDMTKFGELYRAYGYRGATFLSVSLDKNGIYGGKSENFGTAFTSLCGCGTRCNRNPICSGVGSQFYAYRPRWVHRFPQPDGDTVGTEAARTVTLSGEKRYCCVVCAGYHWICETIVNIVRLHNTRQCRSNEIFHIASM